MTITPDRPAASVGAGQHPPFDRELAGPLRAILDELPMPLTPGRIPDRRRRSRAGRLTDAAIRRGGAFTIEERTVPGPPGAPPVPLLICRPAGAGGPVPAVFHTHGGGMVAGSHRSTELVGELDRAQELGLAVVAVDYRLAPEHPDPAPVEDCYAGLVWLAEHAAELGIDPERLVLSGNSAGGALAAGLALLARDRRGPRPVGQLLQFPMLDDRCATDSVARLAHVGLWDGASNRAGWTALLGARRGTSDVSCYAAPARAADVSGLPAAFIEVGSVEALRDEALAYAARIWQAGGEAELHVWSGAFHSFDEWVPGAEISRAAHRARVSWLRRVLVGASSGAGAGSSTGTGAGASTGAGVGRPDVAVSGVVR
ncbi:alpha/beta hydrolase [Streptomyces sp. LHD-70]|uniref:alpha/beta hydrolase n=1 Tax=Streptomyces sp. LHD-70 TaxID=3072140 RepID=UPI00280E80F0|nr:alpha/beta hydrolase [Streptomyces sp. LHD-70]MDQ8706943.1 alpha/beta hydrolase [Streptomyces sp. LHD-70]